MTQEPVVVLSRITIDPAQRRVDLRPKDSDGFEIAGSCRVFSRQQYKQWRGINASIVAAERDLAQPRHLAFAHLVEDLAGLGIVERIFRLRLEGRKSRQHTARQ